MTSTDIKLKRGGLRGLLDFLSEQRARGLSLAVATIVETQGSTYRKSGASMLIASDGTWRGLLSGGCLEGDLAHHAQEIIRSGGARVIEYNLEAMTDAVFGFGLGCEGSVRILLEGLGPDNDWEPFATLGRLALQGHAGLLLRVIDAPRERFAVGAWCLAPADGTPTGEIGLLEAAGPVLPATGSIIEQGERGARIRVLSTAIPRIPHLVLLGAAPDAAPVVALAAALGWRITAIDHRPAFADPRRLSGADDVLLFDAGDPAILRRLESADAAVVMSHNLEADARYLESALASPAPYIGLLGPMARRNRLIEMARTQPTDRSRIHGPVGLDLGGDGPEAVALAIIAEIQMVLMERPGGPRDPRNAVPAPAPQ